MDFSALSIGSPHLWWQLAIVATWLAIVGITAILVQHYFVVETEITRKIVHIGTGNVVLLAWWLQIPAAIGIGMAIAASIVTLVSFWRPILPAIDNIGRKSLGTFFYAVSIGVSIAWFWPLQLPQYAALGIAIMAWGDGLAALVGQRFGRHRYWVLGSQKSWEGSLAMLVVSSCIAIAILLFTRGQGWQTWAIAFTIALCATGLETFSKLGIDNLTVPLGSAAIAFYLCQL